jgi:hypothetical protein
MALDHIRTGAAGEAYRHRRTPAIVHCQILNTSNI